ARGRPRPPGGGWGGAGGGRTPPPVPSAREKSKYHDSFQYVPVSGSWRPSSPGLLLIIPCSWSLRRLVVGNGRVVRDRVVALDVGHLVERRQSLVHVQAVAGHGPVETIVDPRRLGERPQEGEVHVSAGVDFLEAIHAGDAAVQALPRALHGGRDPRQVPPPHPGQGTPPGPAHAP